MSSRLLTDPDDGGRGRPEDIRLFQTTEPFSCRVRSAPESVAVLRGEATAVAVRRGLTLNALYEVTLAVSEAATNAVLHGSAAPTASIAMSIGFDDRGMQITISDDGTACAAFRTAGRFGGRGMAIIRTVTGGDTDVTIGEHASTVRMRFACPSRAHHDSLVRRRRRPAAV